MLASSSEESILVFPAGTPAAIAFAYEASRRGRRVVGASSLKHDCERDEFAEFAWLPWVLEQEFAGDLANLVVRFEIGEIYSSHPVVWERLKALLPSLPKPVTLHSQDWDRQFAGYARQRLMAAKFAKRAGQMFSSESVRPALGIAQLAGLLRLVELTPGYCSHAKLERIVSVFGDLPEGDIVEIGSLFGRTATAFAFLARHYQIGKVLCVDPWSNSEKVQESEPVDEHAKEIDIADIFLAFTANLAPWHGTLNYIRETSVVAARQYSSGVPVVTAEFGCTAYFREIAFLHLDGNHAFDFIRNDLIAWGGFVRAGGWIVFDDYRWHFGDGPRRVADDFCSRFRDCWSVAFEEGGALFVRLSKKISFDELAL